MEGGEKIMESPTSSYRNKSTSHPMAFSFNNEDPKMEDCNQLSRKSLSINDHFSNNDPIDQTEQMYSSISEQTKRQAAAQPPQAPLRSIFDHIVNLRIDLQMCPTCKIVKTPRVFHCKICDACISVHDHHCPWVGTCIGQRNHKPYFIHLLSTNILAFYILALNVNFLHGTPNVFDTQQPTFKTITIPSLVLAIFSGLAVVPLLILTLFHCYLIAYN